MGQNEVYKKLIRGGFDSVEIGSNGITISKKYRIMVVTAIVDGNGVITTLRADVSHLAVLTGIVVTGFILMFQNAFSLLCGTYTNGILLSIGLLVAYYFSKEGERKKKMKMNIDACLVE